MNDNLSSWGIEDAFQSLQSFPPSGNQETSMWAGNDIVELMWQNKQLIMHNHTNHIPPQGRQFVPQHENQTSWFQENQAANQFVPMDDNFCSGIPASKDQQHHTNNIRNNMAGTMANFGLTQDVMTTTAAADNNNNIHQIFNSYYQMLPPNPQVGGGEREYSSNNNFAPQDLVKQTNGVRRKLPSTVASTYDTNSIVAPTYDGLGWSDGRSNIRSYKRNCLRFEEYGSQSEEADDQSFTVGKRPYRSASARRSRAVEVQNISERFNLFSSTNNLEAKRPNQRKNESITRSNPSL